MKFKPTEIDVDGVHNVAVRGVYDNGEEKVFYLDPAKATAEEIKKVATERQPEVDAELEAKKATAQTAVASLQTLVNKDITLTAKEVEVISK